MRNLVRLRASAVVIHEGRVLLVAGKQAKGFWLPPGGHVERAELAAEAAAREAAEETGVQVRAGRLIAWRQVWWDEGDALELYFVAELAQDAAEAERADHGWQWVDVARLGQLALLPEELPRLCELAASGGAGVLELAAADLRGRDR